MIGFNFLNTVLSKLDFTPYDILLVQFCIVFELFEVVNEFQRTYLDVHLLKYDASLAVTTALRAYKRRSCRFFELLPLIYFSGGLLYRKKLN